MRSWTAVLLLVLLTAQSHSVTGQTPTVGRTLEVVGTTFRVTMPDGRVLTSRDLLGVVLDAVDDAGRPFTIRIDFSFSGSGRRRGRGLAAPLLCPEYQHRHLGRVLLHGSRWDRCGISVSRSLDAGRSARARCDKLYDHVHFRCVGQMCPLRLQAVARDRG